MISKAFSGQIFYDVGRGFSPVEHKKRRPIKMGEIGVRVFHFKDMAVPAVYFPKWGKIEGYWWCSISDVIAKPPKTPPHWCGWWHSRIKRMWALVSDWPGSDPNPDLYSSPVWCWQVMSSFWDFVSLSVNLLWFWPYVIWGELGTRKVLGTQ